MDEQIIIGRYRDELDAHMARSYLERNGIESFIKDEHYIGIQPLHWIAMGGVKVTVNKEDELEARTFIAQYESDQLENYTSLTQVCPSCGSSNVRQPGSWNIPKE